VRDGEDQYIVTTIDHHVMSLLSLALSTRQAVLLTSMLFILGVHRLFSLAGPLSVFLAEGRKAVEVADTDNYYWSNPRR